MAKSVIDMLAAGQSVRKKNEAEADVRLLAKQEERRHERMMARIGKLETDLSVMNDKLNQTEAERQKEATMRMLAEGKVQSLQDNQRLMEQRISELNDMCGQLGRHKSEAESRISGLVSECNRFELLLSSANDANARMIAELNHERNSRTSTEVTLRETIALLAGNKEIPVQAPVSYKIEVVKRDGNEQLREARLVPDVENAK